MIISDNPQYTKIFLLCLVSFGIGVVRNNQTFMFDDQVAILKNTDITNTTRPLIEALGLISRHDFWGQNLTSSNSHKSYRPLISIMYHLEFRVFDLRSIVSWMRGVNFLFHCGVCCALGYVMRRILPECHQSIITIAVAIFSIHPIHTECICSIVGRADLFCAYIFLCTVNHYWDFIREQCVSNNPLYLKKVLLALLSMLCMFSKEIGVTVLPFCIALDIFTNFNIPKFREEERSRRFLHLWNLNYKLYLRIRLLAGILIGLTIVRVIALNFEFPKFTAVENPISNHPNFFVRFFTYQYIHALHFWLLICPDWLCFDWSHGSISLIETVFDYRLIFGILIYGFLIACFILGRRPARVAVAFIVIPFLPSSNIFPIGFVVADRILYIPAMGYCLLLSLGFHHLYDRYRNISEATLILVGIILIIRSNQRVMDWESEFSLYYSGIRVNSNNAKIYYNLGAICLQNMQYEKALYFNKKANELEPKQPSTLNNLANAHRHIGNHEKAIMYYIEALNITPDYSMAWMNLAIAYAETHKYDESLNAYLKADEYDPDNEKIIYNIGTLYHRMGNMDSLAGQMFKRAIELNPRNYRAHVNYLHHISNFGTFDELLKACAQAERLAYDQAPVLMTIGDVLAKKNYDFDRTESLYLRVIQLDPKFKRAYLRLGYEYKLRGNITEAHRYYRIAIELDPEIAENDPYYLDLLRQLKSETSHSGEIGRRKANKDSK